MSDVTQFLSRIESGDTAAAEQLFAAVYNELRRMAQAQMANERSEHTLQATALVHEAYVRLLGGAEVRWDSRGHFFGAAAEAMRRILVDHARAKNALKRGGRCDQVAWEVAEASLLRPTNDLLDLLALDEALTKLALEAPEKAELVKLRFFAGLSLEETAEAMNISLATAKRYWLFSRAWLFQELDASQS